MHRSRPTRITAATVTVIVIVVLAVLVVSHGRTHRRQDALADAQGRSNAPTMRGNDAATTPHPFTLSGSIDGLYPGATRTLTIRVDNPNAIPIEVTTIAITVHDASAACLATNLFTSGFAGAVVVPKRASAPIDVTVQMARHAPDACQNASFPLVLSAQAVKA